jgi:serine protease AprX
VVTVGAVNENGQTNPANDTIAPWSSQGTTQDGFHKPDVYAPGAHIVSVLAPNSAFASMCPNCIVNGAYIRTGGTSMAAPMVSGLVADLLSYRPWLTPNQVKGLLMSPYISDNSSIQIPDAMKLSMLWYAPAADQGLTPNTLIDPTTGNIDYSRSSWSRSSWSTATGTLSASWSQSSWSTSSWSTSSWSSNSWSTSSWSTYFSPN